MKKLQVHLLLLFCSVTFKAYSGCPMGSIYFTHGTVSMYDLYTMSRVKFPVIDNLEKFKITIRASCLEYVGNVSITLNGDTIYKDKGSVHYREIQLIQKAGIYKITSWHSRLGGPWTAVVELTGYDPLLIPPDTLGNAAILKYQSLAVPPIEESSPQIKYSTLAEAFRITCEETLIEEVVVHAFDGRLITQAQPQKHTHEIPFTEIMPSAIIVTVRISGGRIERRKFFISR